MLKGPPFSPVDVDGDHRPRNRSRTRLRRYEVKEKLTTTVGLDGIKAISSYTDQCRDNAMPSSSISNNKDSSLNESPPLDASLDDPESDEFAGLRFCSQDSALNKSDDSDNQCEVRWDCYSPHTVKQLKKLRGQYNAEGVRRIVANFNDAHVKPQESSTLKLLHLPGPPPSGPFKEVPVPHRLRAANRKPRRATSHKAVQEMILLLQRKSANKESEAPQTSLEEVSCDGRSAAVGPDHTDDANEDCWSDEDLFQDNSFLIEATQNPEKFMNTSFDVSTQAVHPSAHSKRPDGAATVTHCGQGSESGSPDLSFIPPSCAPIKCAAPLLCSNNRTHPKSLHSKQSNVMTIKNSSSASGSKAAVGRITQPLSTQSRDDAKPALISPECKTVLGGQAKPSSTYCAKFISSVNKFVNENSGASVSENMVPKCQHQAVTSPHTSSHLPPKYKEKSSLRKFNSFQAGDKDGNPGSSHRGDKSSSALSSSFKRTMSFDSSESCSSRSNTKISVITSNKTPVSASTTKSPVITSKPFISSQSKPSPCLMPAPSGVKNIKSPTSQLPWSKGNKPVTSGPAVGNTTPMSFWTKGSNSANSRVATGINSSEEAVSDAVAEDGFDVSLSEDVLQQLLEVDEVFDSQADILASGQPITALNSCRNKISPTSAQSINGPRAPLLAAAPARAVSSLRSNTPVRPLRQRRSLVEPASSTPVKLAKTCPGGTKDEAASDSGTELFDSFLNEDVYESQILPFLEKIEAETVAAPADAVGGCAALQTTSPVKCSPEQIEQKRQAALQRRSSRLSQRSQKSGWR